MELNEIPEVPAEYVVRNTNTKEEEAVEDKKPPARPKEGWVAPEDGDTDRPPCYQELFLNPALLETSELPTYTEVLEAEDYEEN